MQIGTYDTYLRLGQHIVLCEVESELHEIYKQVFRLAQS